MDGAVQAMKEDLTRSEEKVDGLSHRIIIYKNFVHSINGRICR